MKRPQKDTPISIKGTYYNLGDNMSFNWKKYAEDLENYTDWLEEKYTKELANNQIKKQDCRKILIDFFKYFRNNGESNIGMSIEQFIDKYIEKK